MGDICVVGGQFLKFPLLSCTVFRIPGDAAPATYAGPPGVRRPGPARHRRWLPIQLVARLGNILLLAFYLGGLTPISYQVLAIYACNRHLELSSKNIYPNLSLPRSQARAAVRGITSAIGRQRQETTIFVVEGHLPLISRPLTPSCLPTHVPEWTVGFVMLLINKLSCKPGSVIKTRFKGLGYT
jgi:hypothetical protein